MARILDIPGAGDWFRGGIVAYHIDVKVDLLGISAGPVVTAAAAVEMARGVRSVVGSDIGMSITGEAGPVAAEPVPVGTVYIGVSDARFENSYHLVASGPPEEIRATAAAVALDRLLDRLSAGRT
jgi:PncC family amidohydrolase